MTLQPLPTYARRRIAQADPHGTVASIQVRPVRRQPTTLVDAWDLTGSADHAHIPDRAVTLIQAEHLAAIASFLGRDAPFTATRRNLCVRGFNLEAARGQQLRVGEVILELTGRCHPCARMDTTLGAGGFAAMFGHGGFYARIVRSGTIRVGDVVALHDDGEGASG